MRFVIEPGMKITKMVLTTLVLVMVLVGMADFALGATVRVSWNANGEADLAGYRVYYGIASGTYSHVVNVGNSTSADVSGLAAGTTYYFAVTAYDASQNESGYSQEAHTLIPAEATDGSGAGIPVDSDADGIPDEVEQAWGLDPFNPMDSLIDTDGDGVVNLVEYMAGTSPFDVSDYPETDGVLKDIIGEVGQIIDLSAINPQGNYTIVPLINEYPSPEGNTVIMDEPGAFLYNVIDQDNYLVYRLRISTTENISAVGSYNPGFPMDLADQIFGILVELPDNAMIRQVPIGIGNVYAQAASAVGMDGGALEFDILPFGLILAKPATIMVNYEGSNPAVQRYDSEQDTWVNMKSVSAVDGKVSFSSDQLGTFRVAADGAGSGNASSSGGGGGGCFISVSGI